MKKNIVLFAFGIILIIVSVVLFFKAPRNDGPQQTPTVSAPEQDALQPKTDSQGEVEIEVAPLNISKESASWDFQISTNTHTVEIQEDLSAAFDLVDDKGSVYEPIEWNGAPSGHHRTGILRFQPISPFPSFIEMRIKEIGGVPLRVLRWDLNSF